MSFYYHPSIGTFHLQEVKPRRVVPGPERHRWDRQPTWGESATCKKCGCVKHRLKTQPDYTERYQLPGTTQLLPERHTCTPPPAAPVSAAPAGPITDSASTTPPNPTMLPGHTARSTEPVPAP